MKLYCCLLLVVLLGCKEENLNGINSDTRTALLVNKKWQIVAQYVNSRTGAIIRDEYSLLPDFKKDDYYFFRVDSTFELNDHVNQVPLSNSPILDAGTWRFLAADQILDFSGTTFVSLDGELNITSINATELTLDRRVPDGRQYISFKVLP